MFYYPNREQAKKVQRTLETLYAGVEGEYHFGHDAWDYLFRCTSINLLDILEKIADRRAVA